MAAAAKKAAPPSGAITATSRPATEPRIVVKTAWRQQAAWRHVQHPP